MQLTKEHISLLKQGDSKTQKWVFESLYAKMFRVCQRYLVRADEAEDCLMKAFMKAFQQIDTFTYEHDHSKEIAIVKPANKRKTSLKKRGEAPVLVQTKDSILPTMPAITVAEKAPEIVKSRYVEIDFTNEVYAAKFPLANTSEKLVQFRFFKPEIGNHTNAQGGVSLLQFKTNF